MKHQNNNNLPTLIQDGIKQAHRNVYDSFLESL